jgi:tRNA(Ile)-lysidine synthase
MKLIFPKALVTNCYLAFSGGIDSVVLLHLLLRKRVNVTLLTVDHNTDFSKAELAFCKETADQLGLAYKTFKLSEFDNSTSLESFWSRKRNTIFQSMDKPVLTGHHLSDATEWYLMTSCQGRSRVMAYQNGNVQRPLLTTSKKTIIEYANFYRLKYLTDPTNADNDFNLRNKVRNNLMSNVLTVFPGLETTVRKLILADIRMTQ